MLDTKTENEKDSEELDHTAKKGGEGDSHSHDAENHDHDSHGHGSHDPLSTPHLFKHVQDDVEFHVPSGSWSIDPNSHAGHIKIPQPFYKEGVEITPGYGSIKPMNLKITKFMVIEVLVLIFAFVLFGWLARKIKGGKPAKGRFANLLEVLVLFIRDQVARPSIGQKDGDRFVPFLLSLFFFILGCNLMGLVPFLGSPTGAWAVTSVLAIITFGVVCGVGFRKFGVVGFAMAQVPQMDLPFGLGYALKPLMLAIELFGLCLKHFVLSVRLLANMMAGHIILAVFLAFISETAGSAMQFVVWPAACGAYVAIMGLELFVAFLQAYIFTFLAALFIGSASHQH